MTLDPVIPAQAGIQSRDGGRESQGALMPPPLRRQRLWIPGSPAAPRDDNVRFSIIPRLCRNHGASAAPDDRGPKTACPSGKML